MLKIDSYFLFNIGTIAGIPRVKDLLKIDSPSPSSLKTNQCFIALKK